MKGQSLTFDQMTLPITHKPISSPASGSGPTPSEGQDGPMIAPSGQDHAHANLSPRQAKEAGLMTSDTSGQRGIGSSASDALAWSLVSKLRTVSDLLGSTLYELTWKQRVTPSGRSIYALRASARRTSGSGFTSWPTPNTPSGGPNIESTATHTGGMDLDGAATLASWPTPQSSDIKMANRGAEATENEWNREHRGNNLALYAQHLSAWPTPNAMEGGQTSRSGDRKDEMLMGGMVQPSPEGPARLTASGVMLTGSDAGMDGGGQLNQALPRWLQAIPAEWGQAALEAHRKLKAKKARASTRTRPPRSQKA